MSPPISRRHVLAAAGGVISCGRGSIRRQPGRLTYILRSEPYTFDPAKSPGGGELWLLGALFEPLLQRHPETMEPIAGLATHYKVERDDTRYTFFLRGHPAPEGIRLAATDSLPLEFSRGRAGAPYSVPACWSDGAPLTAHDIVYSWRRYLAPETGFASAYSLYEVSGAEEVNSGKLAPERLGVRAIDDLTFQVDLRGPGPDFLKICSTETTLPMPRHAIAEARKRGYEASWTEPGRMVGRGPFILKEYRARERTVVVKNPRYFDAALTDLTEIEFSAADGVTVLNLFRAGLADSMEGRVLPLQLAPHLRNLPAFHVKPACACHNWRINTKRPPLDNVRLRYALNMATDKGATVRFLGAGQTPARSRVPPMSGYQSPQSLPVEMDGRACDVLAYDPRTARELWAAAAPSERSGPLPVHYFARLDSHLLALILQHQWRENLGLETRLIPHEAAVHVQVNLTQDEFSGVAEDSYFAGYADPYDLLSVYTANYANWSDPEFARMLGTAAVIADPVARMEKLAACEAVLLRVMPFVPLYFDTWVYLGRPEVRGLTLNALGIPSFKYGWIDTNWKPS